MAIQNRPIHRVTLDVEGLGDEIDLKEGHGEEALSKLFSFRVWFRSTTGATTPSDLIGRRVTLHLYDHSHAKRDVVGLCAEALVEPHEHGQDTVTLVVRPFAYPLSLGRDCEVFHDMDAVEIAKSVLTSAGVEARFEITGSYPKRLHTVQYRESDWAFVTRLLEEEGIFYWFDHGAGSVLVVGDRSASAPDLEGGPELLYKGESELVPGRDFVFEFGETWRMRPGKFVLGAFDFSKPSAKVAGEHGDDGLEAYDAPGAVLADPAVLAARASARKEAAAVEAYSLEGASPSVRLSPGRAFELADHPVARMDGRYVVIEAKTTIVQADSTQSTGPGHTMVVDFRALRADQPFRPTLSTPWPTRPGLQSGTVVGASGEEVFPDDQGRVRVQQHFDRVGGKDDKSGYWLRVAQRGTAGSLLLPRVGWNVLSMSEEGSPDVPIVLNRTFDGEHLPPYKLPDNKTRVVYKTATTPGGGSHNEIRFEDLQGSEEMFINSTRDMNVLVQDQKTELVRRDMTRQVGVDHSLTVGSTYDNHVKGNQTVTVGGNQLEDVAADRQKLVEGSETIKIGGSRNVTTGANLETSVKSRDVNVGAAQIDVTLGPVMAQSIMVNVLVGGAVVKVTPRTMTESVGQNVSASTVLGHLPVAGAIGKIPGSGALMAKLPSAGAGAAIQTIGVSKIELGLTRTIEVTKSYAERVLGMMTLNTAAYSDITVGLLNFSAKTIIGDSKKVTIESKKKVTLQVGGTTLTVSAADGIKLDAPEVQLSGASLFNATASEIKHNDG
jgi:type VI secretion system secreted protein VgrG